MKYNPLKHNRRSIRLKGYDYSQAGAYFVTICTHGMQHLFGEIINGEMYFNEIGQIAYNEWLKTPEIRPYVSLDVFVIMPNHMHGIIVLNDDHIPRTGVLHTPQSHIPLSNISEKDVCDTPASNQGVFDTPLRSPSHNIGAIVRGYKSAVTKQINLLNETGTIWQRNYHEHIIRNEKSYLLISNYIIDNPTKWQNDKFYTK
jgi:REP element-mobilizing transposase RayT